MSDNRENNQFCIVVLMVGYCSLFNWLSGRLDVVHVKLTIPTIKEASPGISRTSFTKPIVIDHYAKQSRTENKKKCRLLHMGGDVRTRTV